MQKANDSQISSRQGIYRLNLSIGLTGEYAEEINIDDLLEDWQALTDDEFESAIYAAWIEWAYSHVDGGIKKINGAE